MGNFFDSERRGVMKKKEQSDLKKALKKRALGYSYEEQVKELKEVKDEEGNPRSELVVTKVVKKEVQPDTAAIRLLLESEPAPAQSVEEMIKEKERIIREYLQEQQ
jgi:hypothetical protein